MTILRISLYFILLVKISVCSNILAVTTLASPSHHIWHRTYLLNLVQRGHNVTVLTHEMDREKIDNYTVLTLEGVYDKIHKDFVIEDLVYYTPLQIIRVLSQWDENVCKYDLETDGMRKLESYPENYKFDLILWDLNGGKCLYPLIEKFGNPPVIGTSPFGLQPYIGYLFGNHIFSYIPYCVSSLTMEMFFFDRIQNFLYLHFINLYRRYYGIPREEEISRNHFGNSIKTVDEIERNISLLLVDINTILHNPQPLPPSVISVSGIHIKPVQKLPKELEKILDRAKNGVIYVSFGTNINATDIGGNRFQNFIDALGRLPHTVLIKTSKTDIKIPSNVILQKWFPQSDILANPNTKLFISHGGALSTQEALYHGVPIVGMPFFLDQHSNMKRISEKKLGETLNYFEITTDLIYDTVMEVLNNPIYRKNMKIASELHRDQQETPLTRALYWTEYILRHGSAEHLNPITRDLTIFQRFDLDIVSFLLFVVILFVISIYQVTMFLIKFVKSFNNVKLKQN